MWDIRLFPSQPFPADFFETFPHETAAAVYSKQFNPNLPPRKFVKYQLLHPGPGGYGSFYDQDILNKAHEFRQMNPAFADELLTKPTTWSELANFFDATTIYQEGAGFLFMVIAQMAIQGAGKRRHLEETVQSWVERNLQKLMHAYHTGNLLLAISSPIDAEYFDWQGLTTYEQNTILMLLEHQAKRYVNLPYGPFGQTSGQSKPPSPVWVKQPIYTGPPPQQRHGNQEYIDADLYIGNLRRNFSVADLQYLFSSCGKITRFRARNDMFCVFLNYEIKDSVYQAIDRFNGFVFEGQALKVAFALKKRSPPVTPPRSFAAVPESPQTPSVPRVQSVQQTSLAPQTPPMRPLLVVDDVPSTDITTPAPSTPSTPGTSRSNSFTAKVSKIPRPKVLRNQSSNTSLSSSGSSPSRIPRPVFRREESSKSVDSIPQTKVASPKSPAAKAKCPKSPAAKAQSPKHVKSVCRCGCLKK